jgi:hypothetical protein
MIEEIKAMLGDAATNYTDAQISLALKSAIAYIEFYCRRPVDTGLELIAERIAVIILNRMGTEGLAAQSFSGVSESFVDGLPADIMAVLKSKRKLKVI